MSNFFSSIGGRRGGGDTSNYDNPGGDGEDDDQHYQVPPREISFRYNTADYGHGSSTSPCQQQLQQLDLYNYSPSSRRSTSSMHDAERMMMTTMSRGSGGGICCLDCGNQAKKDCAHQRCRTCCKSRGFDCLTHVKSTWVPATRRRERQQHQQHQLHLSSSQLHSRQQLEDPTGAGTSLTHDQSGLEAANFPAELNSPAMFRCVRVSSSDEVEDHDQYAYQTAVNIGGHVFKGILYDQGPDRIPGDAAAGESSSGGGSGGVTQPLSLGGGTAESGGAASAPLFDPYTSMYPPPFNSYNMSGTQFFPPPRSLDPALTTAVSFS